MNSTIDYIGDVNLNTIVDICALLDGHFNLSDIHETLQVHNCIALIHLKGIMNGLLFIFLFCFE